ncbi:hypothetical protein [Actinoplanes palleronii]|uniref:RecT family protein n=1 Tax=Actinoplanes palleronii TaxID=113570 RepID=A0ABQ4BJC5_9ACTN|nr:hypothetical protein [Actinoplanes palleronii]GIE70772.1 hypothetical protein Apa02nite_068800 [Actinoplanes palleronii]
MSEIAMRDEQNAVAVYTDNAVDRLGRWLQQADAVFAIAQKVCSTSFAPAAYRGKPDEAAAAMLAGAELGFDPMASLRAFDNIQGIPAPKAITLRAVVQGAGHAVEIVESTPTRAVVRGRRDGLGDWQTSVWDIDRARAMDLLKKDQWQKQPQAMLVARATAEMCRWIASDAIMGMPYAAEEIGDQPALAPSPAPARRLTMADLDDPVAIDAAPVDEPMTSGQRGQMFALWGELGYAGDENRDARLTVTARILGLESLETSADLTRAEADRIISALIEKRDQQQGGDR